MVTLTGYTGTCSYCNGFEQVLQVENNCGYVSMYIDIVDKACVKLDSLLSAHMRTHNREAAHMRES